VTSKFGGEGSLVCWTDRLFVVAKMRKEQYTATHNTELTEHPRYNSSPVMKVLVETADGKSAGRSSRSSGLSAISTPQHCIAASLDQ
jgi:hypothetical protein